MADAALDFDITKEDLSHLAGKGPAFVTFGETMIRDTPADEQRPERTRLVHLSMGGSEFTHAVLLSRFGIPCAYITRLPDNPYGWQLRDTARAYGISVDHFVWAPKTEPMGRYIYEIGRTPRRNVAWYQRMYSAASRLGPGDVDWQSVLRDCLLLHTSGISFGLAIHSGYSRNYLLEAFQEAVQAKPEACLMACDFNYRSTLWGKQECIAVMTPVLERDVDILVTGVHEMADFYGIGCGRYTAEDILNDDHEGLSDDDLRAFAADLIKRFGLRAVAATLRQPDSIEEQRWEAAVADADGHFVRSGAPRKVVIRDRLGGGDSWNAGFYYGLLSEGLNAKGLRKGLMVGDAATRLQQTLMFDLPVVTKEEVQELIRADVLGGGKQTAR